MHTRVLTRDRLHIITRAVKEWKVRAVQVKWLMKGELVLNQPDYAFDRSDLSGTPFQTRRSFQIVSREPCSHCAQDSSSKLDT